MSHNKVAPVSGSLAAPSEQLRRARGRLRLSPSPTTWLTADKITQSVLWLIVFSILAPILGPRAYGLFSIVMVFVGVSEWILIEGAVEALVTVDELDHLHMSTANVVSAGVAVAFSVLTSALAPAIAILFGDTEIKYLLWTLAPLPVLSALSATPVAMLRRSLNYKQLAVRNIAGLMIGGIFGIVLAIAGAGVWALVLQALAQRFAEFTIVWLSVPVRFKFGWSKAHFREISPVAMNVLCARAMGIVSGGLPRLILGYALGPTEVGLFALANKLTDQITFTAVQPRTAVGRIELRDSRPGSADFVSTFSKMTQHVSILAFPAFCGAAVLSPELFRVWLNPHWDSGLVATQFILLSGVPLVLYYCIDSALLAAKESFVFNWMATSQALTIVATVLGVAPFGLNLICLSLALRAWLLLPVFLLWFSRACHVSVYVALRPALCSLVGAVIMAAVLSLPFLRPQWLPIRYDFIFLIVTGTAFYAIYLRTFAREQLMAFLGELFSRRWALPQHAPSTSNPQSTTSH